MEAIAKFASGIGMVEVCLTFYFYPYGLDSLGASHHCGFIRPQGDPKGNDLQIYDRHGWFCLLLILLTS